MTQIRPEYRPLGAEMLSITAIGELTPEQLAAVTAPFLPNVKPKAVATLQNFSVTCDTSAVSLPLEWRLLAFVWVKGGAQLLAPSSYNPTPPKFLKSGLWRLAPDVTGGQVDNAAVVAVTLPSALPVVRVTAAVRGVFSAAAIYVPT